MKSPIKLLLFGIILVWQPTIHAEECLPVTAADISKIQTYAAAQFGVQGGVVVITEGMRHVPRDSCAMRIPLTARSPNVRFHRTLYLSPDKKYLVSDMIDLSEEPGRSVRRAREEALSEFSENSLPARGANRGLVNVIIFSDFQCPYCNQLNTIIRDHILPKFGDVVTVRLRNLPLASHKWSKDAAKDGICVAEQGSTMFWKFTDRVFADQQEIFSVNDPPGKLAQVVKGIPDIDVTAFNSCLASSKPDSALKLDGQLALVNGIAQTPTIFVDEIRIDGLPTEDDLVMTIQAEITKNAPTPQATTTSVTSHDAKENRLSLEPSLPADWAHLAGILLSARFIAARNNADEIRPEDLLLAIFEEPLVESSSKSTVKALGLPESTSDKLKQEIQESSAPKDIQHGDIPFAASSRSLIAEASHLAQARQHELDGLCLLLALSSNESPLRDKLLSVGITSPKIEQALQNTK